MRGRMLIATGAALVALSLPTVRLEEPKVPTIEPAPTPADDAPSEACRGFARHALPLAFVENRGQWPTPAWYVARRSGLTARLEQHALVLQAERRVDEVTREGVVVRLAFEEASSRVDLVGEQRLPGIHNFFYGQDPAAWRTEVPGYASVLYRGMYGAVDVRVREAAGHLEYDLLLEPGADLEQVVIRCEGVDGMRGAEDGSLVLETALGALRQPPPKTWVVMADGGSHLVASGYRRIDDRRFGFEVPGWDRGSRLVIDPSLIWSTFVGGSSSDFPEDIAVSDAGHVTIAGLTDSLDFPTTAGAYQTSQEGLGDVFVTQLDPTGSNLVFSTYLGGGSGEMANAVALADSGDIVLGGCTQSTDFPVTGGGVALPAGNVAPQAAPTGAGGPSGPGPISVPPGAKGPDLPFTPHAFDTTHNAFHDGFVTRLDATGSEIVFSTYLGGATNNDYVQDVAVDALDRVTVVGHTFSSDFPITPGALDGVFEPSGEGFVARLNPGGTALLFSTYLGGCLNDFPGSVVTDELTGETIVAGGTKSPDFPTTFDAFDSSFGAFEKGFLCRISADGTTLVYSTFFGGTGVTGSTGIIDMAVDHAGAITIGGETSTSNFPVTQGAFDTIYNGSELFVSRFDPTLTQLEFSTFLGGTGSDSFFGLAIDSSGEVTVTGQAGSPDFPTTPNAFDTTHSLGCADAFVSHFDATGNDLLYSTFLGGGSAVCERGVAIARDGQGAAIAVGLAITPSFPVTAEAFDTTFNGGYDAWVARIDTAPAVSIAGPGLAATNGIPKLRAAGGIRPGRSVSLRLSGALANASATLVLGLSNLSMAFKGGTLVPFPDVVIGGLITDASGSLNLSLVWPDRIPSGFTTYWQYWIPHTAAIHGLSASNGLAITPP